MFFVKEGRPKFAFCFWGVRGGAAWPLHHHFRGGKCCARLGGDFGAISSQTEVARESYDQSAHARLFQSGGAKFQKVSWLEFSVQFAIILSKRVGRNL